MCYNQQNDKVMNKSQVLKLISKYSTVFLQQILASARANNHTLVIDAVTAELNSRTNTQG